jgi:Mrp family chromosome partitioning ATPase
MTTESSSSSVRYETLRDYLQVLRRYWIMIAALALIGGGAGYVYEKDQSASYTATAKVKFQDPLQQLAVVGLPMPSVQGPGQLASVAADLVTAPHVIDQVKRELHTSASVGALSGAISSRVAIPSDLLEVSAKASDPTFAADLANTTARVLATQDNAQAQAQFTHLAAVVQQRLTALQRHVTPGTSNELLFYEDELGRLQTLSSSVQTAQVAKPASATISSSTGATGSALLGLLFGLLLGILAAFARDVTDRRLRGGKDVKSSFGLPVLGHVRNQAMGRIVQFADSSRGGNQLDVEAFRILRRNIELIDPAGPPKVVLVTSAVAEEGKTTVAASLAAAIASAGRLTLLIEADLRRPALASRLRVDPAPGLTDYLAGTATPQDVLRTIEFSEPQFQNGSAPSSNGHSSSHLHRLVYVPSGSRTSRSAELIGSAAFRELIEEVSQRYDAVVLDAPPLLPVSDTLEMLPYADAVVLCVRESQTTRDQAAAAKTALERFPKVHAGIVVTGLKLRGAGDEAVYAHEYSLGG